MNIDNKLWDAALIAAESQHCSRPNRLKRLLKKRFFNLPYLKPRFKL